MVGALTDSAPSSPVAKRTRAEQSHESPGEADPKKPRKRRPGVKGSSAKPATATQTVTKEVNAKPKKRAGKKRAGKKRARSTSSASAGSAASDRSRTQTPAPLVIGIDLEVMEEGSARQRKGKEKERLTKFDAFEVDSSTRWAAVLAKIASKLHTDVGCLRQDTFFWRPSQPKNAEDRALNSEDAWKICVKRLELKPKSPFIVIRMAPPNPAPKQPSWAQPARPGPSAAPTTAGSSRLITPADSDPPSPVASGTSANPLPPSLGSTDAILIPIVQKLQALYPMGSCLVHPTRHCFYHASTRRHYAVEGLAAKAWATQIHFQKTDYYRIPSSTHFHPSNALPTAEKHPGAGSMPQPQPIPTANMPVAGGALYPATPTTALSHNQFMSPFPSFNPFAMFGFSPQPQFAPLGHSVSTPIRQHQDSILDGPLSSPPKGMTLRDWCIKYKLDDNQYDGLVKLGFKIGMDLGDIREEEWREAGFTRLTWKQTFSAAAAYRADRVRAKSNM
ncbi:hypothetical protein FRC00_002273 [Tulasnella sp. 408]|nr:hypothetical protein FRC00_002273 [Tulasnella sp. 408]